MGGHRSEYTTALLSPLRQHRCAAVKPCGQLGRFRNAVENLTPVDHEGGCGNQMIVSRQAIFGVNVDITLDDDDIWPLCGDSVEHVPSLWAADAVVAVEKFDEVRHAGRIRSGAGSVL
jgi:hypothetical protein